MAQSVVVVGAGGLGREVAEAIRAGAGVDRPWQLAGFVDDDPSAPGEVAGAPVLGTTADLAGLPDVQVVLAVANPARPWARRDLAGRLGLPGGRYATVVHPHASLGASVVVGAGSVVLAGVVATADVVLGDHVVVMPGCVLTHDDRVGDHATFGAGVRLAGGVTVGAGCYVGSGALVREGVTLGAGSVVGMGAVVLGDVGPGEVWVGNPARHLRDLGAPPSPAP